jgi:hypothetical protein
MATRKKRTSLYSPEGVACFVNVFTPRARKDAKGNVKGDPKYSLLLVFDRKTDKEELEEEVERVAVEKFGSKARDMLAKGKLHNPLRDASDYEQHGEPFTKKGAMMAAFKSSDAPGVVDENGDPITKKEFYSGCIARVTYRAYAYDNESKGVALALVNVQKLEDGTRLSGNPSAEDEFGGKRKNKGDDDDDIEP